MKKILIERTKKGFPALWEQGGGRTNTGEAQIICDSQGNPKKPVYIRRAGQLANREHALFIVEPGDIVVRANHHREDFSIEVLQVKGFEKSYYDEKYSMPVLSPEKLIEDAKQSGWVRNRGGKVLPETLGEYKSAAGHLYRYVLIRIPETFAVCSTLAQFDMGEWYNEEAAEKFADAISAAKEKATCYHCREPHYIITE